MEESIKRALLSVSKKDGIVEFARGLCDLGIELVATEGTRELLNESGIHCKTVEEFTSLPSMMGGRVKTLHPGILGGVLARRDVESDLEDAKKHKIQFFDLVVVNLYPFQETILKTPDDLDKAIEQIDIGGPTMVRAAAKNYKHVAVIVDPQNYDVILEELKKNNRTLAQDRRLELATEAFRHVSMYDAIIARYLKGFQVEEDASFPVEVVIPLIKSKELRYGENPHQKAAFYRDPIPRGGWTSRFTQLWGKELSTNNILDSESAWRLMSELQGVSCVIVKHNNPCGVGLGSKLKEAYSNALKTDPVSAFGGIVAVSESLDEETALLMSKHFFEVIMAPEYEDSALELLEKKKNLRILKIEIPDRKPPGPGCWEIKSVEDGAILQERDLGEIDLDDAKIVTEAKPTDSQLRALGFAWTVAKHVKSNAIVLACETGTIGIGAGQMSRVDSVWISVEKARRAKLSTEGAVLASDAFFPFRDGIDEAATAGIGAIIQPGGSIRDREVIEAANERGISMIFTSIRHFRH
ncbi:MAG: bifunctional phosphoribosylaminoimidazolecarboxamide formyltransferase/IMP cyclohydrolase [Candidatus Glassbacteria bacterium]